MICKRFVDNTSFICTQLNGFKYSYVISIIQFRHTGEEFQVLLLNINNSIQHYLFVCAQLNASSLFLYEQNIQLDSHLLSYS